VEACQSQSHSYFISSYYILLTQNPNPDISHNLTAANSRDKTYSTTFTSSHTYDYLILNALTVQRRQRSTRCRVRQ
jgi:hypothetical protein